MRSASPPLPRLSTTFRKYMHALASIPDIETSVALIHYLLDITANDRLDLPIEAFKLIKTSILVKIIASV